jgi:hypothetical protein
MGIPLLTLLPLILTFTIDILTDVRQWGRIKHVRGALLRVPGIALTIYLDPMNAILVPAYWGCFDITIALAKGLPWWYVGFTSTLDRAQRKFKWLMWVKWGLVIVCPVLYVILV